MDSLRDDKPLWGAGEVLRLALPTAAGMVNWTILTFVDALMVSRLIGPEALSAQFVAGILAFVPASLALGVLGVVNTFVAQNLGAGRLRRCGQYTWAGGYLAVALAAAMLPLIAACPAILRAFGGAIGRAGGAATTAGELAMQATYFRYLVGGQVVGLLSSVLEQFFYGIHRPGVVYLSSLLSAVVNAVMDYVLIKGLWGLPAMGMKGAAVASVLGWAASFALLAWLFLRGGEHRRYHTRTTWRPRVRHLADILRVGWPAGVQFCGDVSVWAIFNTFLVGYFGAVHKAASAAATKYMNVAFLPVIGLSIAVTALVGRHIGAGSPERARRRTHAAVALGVAYSAICSAVFLAFRYPLIDVFAEVPRPGEVTAIELAAQRAEVLRIGAAVMVCAAVFQCFDAVGIVFRGALRGAGDTMWMMLIMLALSAAILVGGGVATVRYAPGLTSIGPWLAASAYVIVLGFVMAWRFESGQWRKIDLLL